MIEKPDKHSYEMEKTLEKHSKSLFEKIIGNKGIIFFFMGVTARIFMLFYYYYTHMIDPHRGWGDVGLNFRQPIFYPPLCLGLLNFFRYLSFGSIEIFAFYAFLWDLLTSLMFYFVLKSFGIKNKNYVFGLFLINPFWFLNNSFSLINCGYHITDSFFFFFFFMALIFYPKKELRYKYLFYLFLGLSMCTKYYTLPALVFLFLKNLYDKNWKEMKIFLVTIAPLLIIFILIPFSYLDYYSKELFTWYSYGSYVPLHIRIIPIVSIFLIFTFFRLKKSDPFEIIIVSIVAMASFMFFSYPYLRWFQSIIFYGILKKKDFFTFNLNLGVRKIEIVIDNHLLTFFLSMFGVLLSYLFILFIFG